MIITTSQDLAALDCCGCAMPQCDAPRKECESVYVDACGFTLPAHEDLPTVDACQIYRKRTDAVEFTTVNVETSGIYVTTFTLSESANNVTEQYGAEGGGCTGRFFSGSFYENSNVTNLEDGVLIQDDTTIFDTSAGLDGVWAGTVTYDYDPDPGGSSGTAFSDASREVAHTITNDWTYTSPGVYTISNPTGDETSRTETVTFSEPVDSTALEANLDEIIAGFEGGAWPGTGCASIVSEESVFDESDPPELLCERLTGATKSRYRFGIPSGYTRSVWAMQWDEVFAPDDWWAWFDGGRIGTEPTPGPSLVAAKSWTWSGAGDWSDWYEIPLPTEPGETRVVNVLTKCYPSTRLGVVPTLSGPSVALP